MPLAKGFVPPSRMELVPWSMPMARVQAQTKLQFWKLSIPNSKWNCCSIWSLCNSGFCKKQPSQSCQYHRNKTSLDTSGFSYEGQWQYGQQLKWHKNHCKTLLVSSLVSRCSSGQGPMGHLQGTTHYLRKPSYFFRLEINVHINFHSTCTVLFFHNLLLFHVVSNSVVRMFQHSCVRHHWHHLSLHARRVGRSESWRPFPRYDLHLGRTSPKAPWQHRSSVEER